MVESALNAPKEPIMNGAGITKLSGNVQRFTTHSGIPVLMANAQGHYREENEDRAGHTQVDEDTDLFVVVDGMGGQANGSEAAQGIVQAILAEPNNYRKGAQRSQPEMIACGVDTKVAPEKMGGGLFAAIRIHKDDMEQFSGVPFRLGDCKYAVIAADASEVIRESQDRNLATAMADNGTITHKEAKTHKWRHKVVDPLTPVNDNPEKYVPDEDETPIDPILFEEGEFFYLASDGVTAKCPPSKVAEILRNVDLDLDEAMKHISDETEGTKDNQTIILGRIPKKPVKSSKQAIATASAVGAEITNGARSTVEGNKGES